MGRLVRSLRSEDPAVTIAMRKALYDEAASEYEPVPRLVISAAIRPSILQFSISDDYLITNMLPKNALDQTFVDRP